MLLSLVLASVLALTAIKIVKPAISKVSPSVMIKALVLFWFLTPLIVAVPFSYFAKVSLPDAYFEMVSEFTGTGFTILQPSKENPFVNALRATSQWAGEVGALFLTLILAIVFHVSPTGIVSALGKGERVRPSMYKTLIDLVMIYIVLTAVPIAYMYLSGMKLYDAIVYTFAALATGGFAPTNGGTADLPFVQQALVMLTCLLGATNFSVYLSLRYGKVRQALSHPELKMLVGSVLFYAFLLLLVWRAFDPWHVWSALFHSASAVTTSGFQIADVSKFSESAKYIITIAMIVGASAFSTGGGIKLFRAYVLGKLISRELRSVGAPRGYVNKITVMGKEISEDDLVTMLTVVATYIFTLLAIALIITELMSIHKVPAPSIDIIFEVASAMSGTGLSSGLVNVAPTDVRLILAAAMIVGKLEVLPFLYALVSAFRALRGK
jgi:trk system potassium uptake protein TrkH